MDSRHEISRWLSAVERGESGAQDELAPLVYDELRELAARFLKRESPGHTWQPTVLVHEVWMRLFGGEAPQKLGNRRIFFSVAAEAMRRLLVDHARKRDAQKRGGGRRAVTLEDLGVGGGNTQWDVLAMDEALNDMELEVSERHAEVVKLRFFVGLSVEEVARTLDSSAATVKRDWVYARAWLYERLSA